MNRFINRYGLFLTYKHGNEFDKDSKTWVLSLVLNIHNCTGIPPDKFSYIALCPASFFSDLFYRRPQTTVEGIRTKMMVPDPAAADHVRLMFETYAEPGTSFRGHHPVF